MQKVFISILNFNGRKNTIDCLNSIAKIKKTSFELKVLVIDNGSEEELELPSIAQLDINLIKNKKNLGFSEGHNVGIKYALENGANFVLILNNDTVVDKDLIDELLKSSNENTGITAPKIYFYKGSEFHKDKYKEKERGKVFWYTGGEMDWKNVIASHRGVDEVDHGQYDTAESTDFASGCCMMIRREVFEKVGLFDDKFFLYYEDNDLSQRAKRLGFDITYNPKAILWHKNAGSVGGSGSALQDYYITRNRMLFGMRFAPLRSKISLLRESLGLLLWGRPWQKRGVFDFYKGNFGKGSFKI